MPVPPYPHWAQTDTALASVSALMRRLHEAALGFDLTRASWSTEMADPDIGSVIGPTAEGGVVVCHNDVCLENVVFRDGVAVGLLDFDFAAPGRPGYDLAQMARMCAPVDDPLDAARLGWRPDATAPERIRLVADAYGLEAGGRRALFDALDDSMRVAASSCGGVWRREKRPSWRCGSRWGAWPASTAGGSGGPA